MGMGEWRPNWPLKSKHIAHKINRGKLKLLPLVLINLNRMFAFLENIITHSTITKASLVVIRIFIDFPESSPNHLLYMKSRPMAQALTPKLKYKWVCTISFLYMRILQLRIYAQVYKCPLHHKSDHKTFCFKAMIFRCV